MSNAAVPTDPPAKIWELLRRNHAFHRKVDELKQLDAAHKTFQRTHKVDTLDDEHYVNAMALMREMEASNAFAACALQWLVPDPLFITTVVSEGGEMICEYQRRTPKPIPRRLPPTDRKSVV